MQLEPPRPQRWSTDEVDPGRALAYWIDTVCDRFLELEIDTPLRERFSAQLEQAQLGAATLNVISADTQRIQRTRAKIAHSRYPAFFLLQLREGQMRLRQRQQEAFLRAGESVLIAGTEPYELECPEPTRALVLRLPEHWLERWIPHAEDLTVRVLAGAGWNAALNAALSSLEVRDIEHLALPGSVVAEQLAMLLVLAAGREPQAPGPRLLQELLRTLRDRLHETNLSALVVAAQHNISKRSLHYAFARSGTTFNEQLMQLRLERAQQLLGNPQFAEVPISEIAAQCGFVDPSHFARRFRARFGQAPLEARRSRH